MQEKIIKEMARKLAEDVRKDGKAMQCFGPWNQGMKNNNTKAHTELEEELRKLKIKTIKINDYVDLYIPCEMDDDEKHTIIEQCRKSAPSIMANILIKDYNINNKKLKLIASLPEDVNIVRRTI
ncbi:MAG: hypothetical protein ACLS90_05790 [Clostridia bacterium]